jgi:MoaA/NifB/PqqE/SkfB family radical SAM enzyme
MMDMQLVELIFDKEKENKNVRVSKLQKKYKAGYAVCDEILKEILVYQNIDFQVDLMSEMNVDEDDIVTPCFISNKYGFCLSLSKTLFDVYASQKE